MLAEAAGGNVRVYGYGRLLHTAQCTVHSARCIVHSVQCTVHSVQCTVYSAQYTVYSAQCPGIWVTNLQSGEGWISLDPMLDFTDRAAGLGAT